MKRFMSLTGGAARRFVQVTNSFDRLLAVLALVTDVVIGVLLIVATVAPLNLAQYVIVIVAVVIVAGGSLAIFSRTTSARRDTSDLAVMSESTEVEVDIRKNGKRAIIRETDRLVAIRDALEIVHRLAWGDWEHPRLTDMKCHLPLRARIVHLFRDNETSVFVVWFRHPYRRGDRFVLTTTLTVRGGFTGETSEFFEYRGLAPVGVLTLRVVLPLGKRLVRGSVRRRVGHASDGERIDEDTSVSIRDGRQVIELTWHRVARDATCGITWEWEPDRQERGLAA